MVSRQAHYCHFWGHLTLCSTLHNARALITLPKKLLSSRSATSQRSFGPWRLPIVLGCQPCGECLPGRLFFVPLALPALHQHVAARHRITVHCFLAIGMQTESYALDMKTDTLLLQAPFAARHVCTTWYASTPLHMSASFTITLITCLVFSYGLWNVSERLHSYSSDLLTLLAHGRCPAMELIRDFFYAS